PLYSGTTLSSSSAPRVFHDIINIDTSTDDDIDIDIDMVQAMPLHSFHRDQCAIHFQTDCVFHVVFMLSPLCCLHQSQSLNHFVSFVILKRMLCTGYIHDLCPVQLCICLRKFV